MKKIPLTKGFFALVDDEDYERVAQYRWHVTERRPRKKDGVVRRYAVHDVRRADDTRTVQYMHDLIMGRKPGDDWEVDHLNGDGLDDRRSNMRRRTRSENLRNSHRHRDGSVIGVYFERRNRRKPWCVYIGDPSLGHYATRRAKQRYLGSFATREEAEAVAKAFLAERDKALHERSIP